MLVNSRSDSQTRTAKYQVSGDALMLMKAAGSSAGETQQAKRGGAFGILPCRLSDHTVHARFSPRCGKRVEDTDAAGRGGRTYCLPHCFAPRR